MINLLAEFDVSSFSRCRDIIDAPKWSCDPGSDIFFTQFCIFTIVPPVSEIERGLKFPPKWSLDSLVTNFTQCCIFYDSAPVVDLHAKFRLASFSSCRDIEGVLKFPIMFT